MNILQPVGSCDAVKRTYQSVHMGVLRCAHGCAALCTLLCIASQIETCLVLSHEVDTCLVFSSEVDTCLVLSSGAFCRPQWTGRLRRMASLPRSWLAMAARTLLLGPLCWCSWRMRWASRQAQGLIASPAQHTHAGHMGCMACLLAACGLAGLCTCHCCSMEQVQAGSFSAYQAALRWWLLTGVLLSVLTLASPWAAQAQM